MHAIHAAKKNALKCFTNYCEIIKNAKKLSI